MMTNRVMVALPGGEMWFGGPGRGEELAVLSAAERLADHGPRTHTADRNEGMMMGLRTFSDLVGEITPDERAEIDTTKEEAAVESVAFNLAELRQARKMTKLELAYLIGRAQPVTSQMEEVDDHLLSTIRGVVESLGGRLELIAVFDDDRIPIDFSSRRTAGVEDREHMAAAVE